MSRADCVFDNVGGTIGPARSPDPNRWTVCPPVFSGGFGQLEVPQVLRIGERWSCPFRTAEWD